MIGYVVFFIKREIPMKSRQFQEKDAIYNYLPSSQILYTYEK
jgi:hypothetical protein